MCDHPDACQEGRTPMRDRMLSMCRGALVSDTNVYQAVFRRRVVAQTGRRIKGLDALTH